MTKTPAEKSHPMPKGGRKGGSVFPRVALNAAIKHALKLVSKTHTAAQPKDVILSGVIGAKGGNGNVRMSALKQYGFLTGDVKTNFSAGDLAKKVAAAPEEELIPLYRQAVLKPTIFKALFDTFHGDTVSKGKLKQRAADLKVHPDETGTCVDLYVSGMTTAQLVTVQGDQVKHLAMSDVAKSSDTSATTEMEAETTDVVSGDGESNDDENGGDMESAVEAPASDKAKERDSLPGKPAGPSRPQAVFNVNVTLDSSLDIEKLQKQLELLKRFGAI